MDKYKEYCTHTLRLFLLGGGRRSAALHLNLPDKKEDIS